MIRRNSLRVPALCTVAVLLLPWAVRVAQGRNAAEGRNTATGGDTPVAATTSVLVPTTALAMNSPAVDDTLLAYALPPATPSGRGSPIRLVGVPLRATARGLAAAPPRTICTVTGTANLMVAPLTAGGGWVVYVAYSYHATQTWTLAMCQVSTGRRVVLDTSARERGGGDAPGAHSDGHTVVWATLTRAPGRRAPTSVVYAYDLATGRQRVLAEGGSPDTFVYAAVSVSGRRVLFEKQNYVGTETDQFLLADLNTGRMRALAPPRHDIYGPTLSGEAIAYGLGGPDANGGNAGVGVGAYNVRTGRRVEIVGSIVTSQQAVAGHDIVYVQGVPPANDVTTLWLYDLRTGHRTALDRPDVPRYYGSSSDIFSGGRTVAYIRGTPGSQTRPSKPVVIILLT